MQGGRGYATAPPPLHTTTTTMQWDEEWALNPIKEPYQTCFTNCNEQYKNIQ